MKILSRSIFPRYDSFLGQALIILGAVSIGKDLQRNASYQKISQSFIQECVLVYRNHFNRVNLVIADDPTSPTLMVIQNNGEICGDTLATSLYTYMDTEGVRMPHGRSEGSEDKYVYLDSNSNPQQIEICFDNILWSVDDINSLPNPYTSRNKNVMLIKGLTPDLARLLDNSVDGMAGARFGLFRESIRANETIATQRVWSKTNKQNLECNYDSILFNARIIIK